jgi:hypothetical protein
VEHPPHAFVVPPEHWTAFWPLHCHMPPHDPQLVFGVLDNVAQPPQAFVVPPMHCTAF